MVENLNLKLSGELPVTKDELIELVSSWGRIEEFNIESETINDYSYFVEKCEPKECYPLENINVSQIIDFNMIFACSQYNGDLSKWDVSNSITFEMMFINSQFNNDSIKNWNTSKVENMDGTFYDSIFNGDLSGWNTSNCKNMMDMFAHSKFNNNSISNWDVSNVINMSGLFQEAKFNGNISSWDVSNVANMRNMFFESFFNNDISYWKFNETINCDNMFYGNNDFDIKYNNNNMIPRKTKDFLEWFEDNRDKMRDINTSKEEVLDFFSFDDKSINIDK